MEDIKEQFVHDVSIGQVASVDSLETSIGFSQFSDNPHRLQGCIIAHGSSVFAQLPILAQVKLHHHASFCPVWRVICQHQLGKEIEEHRHCCNWRIGFRILVKIEDDFIDFRHILIRDRIP